MFFFAAFHPSRRCRPFWVGVLACLGIGGGIPSASAMPIELLSATPADAPAAVFVSPAQDAPGLGGASVLGLLNTLMERGRQMGLLGELDAQTRLILDLLASVPTVSAQPFGLVLTDFSTVRSEKGSSTLESLGCAVVMLTGDRQEQVVSRVQQLLNLHTNRDVSRVEEIHLEGVKCFRLTDSRMPAWCVLEWGQVGPCYVVAVGRGALEKVVRAGQGGSSLIKESWFADAFARVQGGDSYFQVYSDIHRIRRGFGLESSVRTQEGLRALHLEAVRKGLWSVRMQGRAVEVVSVLEFPNRTERVPLTTEELGGQAIGEVVPAESGSYMVLARGAKDLILRFRDLYLATKHPAERERLTEAWLAEEAKVGVSFDRDFLGQLGDRMIFHTYPRHVLNLPFLCTILVQIEGSSESVQRSLDLTLTRLNEVFPCNWPGMTPDGRWLRRDADGLWYVQFGLIGPALAVTDKWIVFSYSPQAVRDNLTYMRQAHSASVNRP